ncbi:class I SAM-dependent methyltransferase [Flavobacterium sp. FlaQc-48]|uniref:class I SAM-dependent methyltransferase n=1 Tax=Flavobacterium sp. FlaQc-48 TaxID=3374181 RepID=UPI0037571954
MKVENKVFWENQDIIATQDQSVSSSANYEVFLYEKVVSYLKGKKKLSAKVFGCGTGREIPEIIKHIGVGHVFASDIAENMIKKCNENLINWELTDVVITQVVDAAKFESKDYAFDVVTIMNNMLTYVTDKKQRNKIFKNSYEILNDKGCIIGVVHNQIGTPQKTGYFLMRRFLKPFLKNEVGYRLTGFKGLRFGGYYFTKKDLYRHLNDNNFKNIEIISLAEFSEKKGFAYDRLRGSNNLLFFATKY